MVDLVGDASTTRGHVRGLRFAVRIRPVLDVGLLLASSALFWCWVLLPASPVRYGVTAGCAGLALLALVVPAVVQLAAGRPQRRAVYAELSAYGAEALPPGVLPRRLLGRNAERAVGGLSLMVVLFGALMPLVLASGPAVPSDKVSALKTAGVERSRLPVERVLKRETLPRKPFLSADGDAYHAATVRFALPRTGVGGGADESVGKGGGVGQGGGVGHGGGEAHVTHRLATEERLTRGSEVYVAYAPSRPGLGVVAGDDATWVERELAGMTLDSRWRIADYRWSLVLPGVWCLGFAVWLVAAVARPLFRRRLRTLRGDEHAVRVRVTGTGTRTERGTVLLLEPADGGASAVTSAAVAGSAAAVGDGGASTAGIAFSVPGSEAQLSAATGSHTGTLLWHPVRGRGRHERDNRMKAEDRPREDERRFHAAFVADAGWHLPGWITMADARTAVAADTTPFQVRRDGRARLLNLRRGWPLTVSRSAVAVFAVVAACAVVLTLPVQLGDDRLVFGTVGLAPAALTLLWSTAVALRDEYREL